MTAPWRGNPSVDQLNRPEILGGCAHHLGVAITAITADYLEGTLPVDGRTIQPFGILNGGASCVLAETLGSLAANLCLPEASPPQVCVGQSLTAHHLRPASQGEVVTGRATPIHIGRKSHVWQVTIQDTKGRDICLAHLTMSIVANKA